MINKRVEHLKRQEYVESVQYAVSSLSSLEPQQALRLVQGHWRIENSFGEDRHVMFHHGGGAVLSLLRNVAITLPRGTCSLCSDKGTTHPQGSATLRSHFHSRDRSYLTLERPWVA